MTAEHCEYNVFPYYFLIGLSDILLAINYVGQL